MEIFHFNMLFIVISEEEEKNTTYSHKLILAVSNTYEKFIKLPKVNKKIFFFEIDE